MPLSHLCALLMPGCPRNQESPQSNLGSPGSCFKLQQPVPTVPMVSRANQDGLVVCTMGPWPHPTPASAPPLRCPQEGGEEGRESTKGLEHDTVTLSEGQKPSLYIQLENEVGEVTHQGPDSSLSEAPLHQLGREVKTVIATLDQTCSPYSPLHGLPQKLQPEASE